MNDLISIIVPVYNAEKTLERCIISLIGQTYKKIEIILVNDGSKDDSLKICRRFEAADVRIRVIDKPNGGVSSARNAGLNTAQGEFVMFCDSDDWVEPDWCECLLRNYNHDSLIMCEYSETTSLNSTPRSQVPFALTTFDKIKKSNFIYYRENGIGSPTTKIFCRDIIENNQIRFHEKLFLGEDLIFNLDYLCAIHGDIIFIRKKLYNYYTMNSESLSKSVPSYEQCELFYQLLSKAMVMLNAQDITSQKIRNNIVLCDYEKIFIHIAKNNALSICEKFNLALKAINYDSFLESSKSGMVSDNRLYMGLYRHKYIKLIILYYVFFNNK